jgi:GTPase
MQTVETRRRERAVLVGVATDHTPRERVAEYLDELALLATSAEAEIIQRVIQDRHAVDPATFVGKGKADELSWLVHRERIDLVIFDDDLSPVQIRNLERIIVCKIIDRSGLILHIFATRARSSEAKNQVELAQMQYMLPRLTRQWTHLSKQFGGIGTKGPGETQIETDRRAIRAKISTLRRRLERITQERDVQRKGRSRFPRLALVGYTNAGKSTLMNWFSRADVLVEDKLFATLDSTVRLVSLSAVHKFLLSDTVGFIRKLPHQLVASFKSTLEEVTHADLLVHVVDISHPLFEEQMTIVDDTLEEIGAHEKPRLLVFNKTDLVRQPHLISYLTSQYENSAFVSATRGINMTGLAKKIMESLDKNICEREIRLKSDDYKLLSQIHDLGEIVEEQFEDGAITVRFRMNNVHADRLEKLIARRSE